MEQKPITEALARVERGEVGADESLWHMVYDELKGMAAARLSRLRPGQTLQATALVHEAWVRLGGRAGRDWEGRAHFFGAAARSMRNILVDEARSKARLKRGSGRGVEQLTTNILAEPGAEPLDVLALDEALDALQQRYERPARIVMLRYFAGLTIAEVAEVLGVQPRTVDRDFLFARTWLRRFMDGS